MGVLDGKVALITGGTSGIGASAASLFCEEGAQVVIIGRRQQPGDEIEAELRAKGHDAVFVSADITVEVDVVRMVKQAIDAFGKVDVAFLNSGITSSGAMIKDMTEDDFMSSINQNLKGPFLCFKHLIPVLPSPGGAVVFTSSIASIRASTTRAAYSAAKAGLNMFARAAAMEVARAGIRVNVVCPAGVLTPMSMNYARRVADQFGGLEEAIAQLGSDGPIGRMSLPEEVARAALFLASDQASMTTGHILPVDGGSACGTTKTQ